MKMKKILSCFLGCLLVVTVSCNEATPEQIKETELATKKEKMLDEMHEEEVKELVTILTEKAKDKSFYDFVNLGKKVEEVKDNPFFNIINYDKGYALRLHFLKVEEIPEYKKIWELHKKYHFQSGLDWDNMTDEEFDEYEAITNNELRKWNIENNKIKEQKGIGKYTLIENTVCPYCRREIDDENLEEDHRGNYILDYIEFADRPYFKKYKMFGYYLRHPEELQENFEETVKNIEKTFEAYELPLYTIPSLLKEYNSGLEKVKKNDEFGINGQVTNYRKSWNKKVVRVKGKIKNIKKTYYDERDIDADELLQWEITVDSEGYEMHLYFDYSPKGLFRLGGRIPVEEDIIKFKKNDEIIFVAEMFINNSTEWICDFPLIGTTLHFGYAEILEINGVQL